MADIDYPACIRELYESEIFGEALTLALTAASKNERERYHNATLLQLETETKARLRPLLFRYGLSLSEQADPSAVDDSSRSLDTSVDGDGGGRRVGRITERDRRSTEVSPRGNKGTIVDRRRSGVSLSCAEVAAQSVDPLVHEGTIDAPIEAVWLAWTTSEGLQSWLAPHAEIDLRVGGTMRANYNDAGNLDDAQTIENRILSYEPYRMMSIQVSQAPENFPFADVIGQMWTVVYFESAAPQSTTVRIVSLGFSDDEQSQAMRAFFEQGNAVTLQQMQDRLGGSRNNR